MSGLDFDDLKEQLNWYSGAISSAVRTTSFGVIAAIWAIFTADGLTIKKATLFGLSTSDSVTAAFVCASGSLLADILQYVCAYWMTSICVDKFEVARENNKRVEFYYDRKCLGGFGLILYKVSFYLLPIKLILAIASAVSFVFVAFSVSLSIS